MILTSRWAISLGVAAALAAGGSYAAAGGNASRGASGQHKAEKSSETTDEDAGAHGGSVDRFHGDTNADCAVPDGATLSQNWTHGDYVSAWATATDGGSSRDAARSACGKPLAALGHGVSSAHKGSQPAEPPGLSRRPPLPPRS